MTEQEIIAKVRDVIRQELAQTLLGRVSSTTGDFRSKAKRFQYSDNDFDARLIQQYGLASRPKSGMQSIISPLNADPTHLVVMGQFDDGRPKIEENEVCLYGPTGKVVYMKEDSTIHMGALTAAQQAVLGNVLSAAITSIINRFLNAESIGESAAGEVFLSPEVRAGLVEDLQTYVTDTSTNILAQKIFLERGEE